MIVVVGVMMCRCGDATSTVAETLFVRENVERVCSRSSFLYLRTCVHVCICVRVSVCYRLH